MAKSSRDYGYAFRTFRIYDPEALRAFTEICKSEYSDPNKEVNRFIARVVQAGTIAREARRG